MTLRIGDLARHTGVSVRMLRHYDTLGLVTPEQVDPRTGYRWYAVSQIGRVKSLVALKELGFSLDECRVILDDQVSVAERRDMLRQRQAELVDQIAADSRRLDEVRRRLHSIERGLTVTNDTLTLTSLPALRLAQVRTAVNDSTEISEVTGQLFETLTQRLTSTGHVVEGRGIRTYFGRPDGSKIDVAAAVPLADDIEAIDGIEVVELPAEPMAASVIHRGSPADIAEAWHTFGVACEQRDLVSHGIHRQVYLDAPEHTEDWVVELQCPVRQADAACPPTRPT